MDTAANAGDPLARAWKRFDAGDKAEALRLAREASAATRAPQADAALGYFLLEAGQLAEAQAVLQAACTRTADHAVVHWYLGLLAQRQGATAQAAASLRHACHLNPHLDEAAFTLAWVLHDLGQLLEALGWAQRALLAARRPERLLQAGWLRQALGQVAEAVPLYDEAIAAFAWDAPEQVRLHLHRAQCQTALGAPGLAGDSLAQGLERHPTDPELLTAMAFCEWNQGNQTRAIAMARTQAEAYSDNAAAWHLLGVLQQQAGDLRAADASFAEVQQRDLTRSDALLRRAALQAQWNRPTDALWLLQQVLAHDPGSQAAQDLMTQVLLDLGRTDEARRLLHKRLRGAPDHADAWRLLAVAHTQRGRKPLARRTLGRALRHDAGNVEALRMLTWTAMELADTNAAVNTVQRLLQCVPDDQVAKVQAAFVFAAAGDLPAAAGHAERAVAQDPQSVEAWRALSQVRYRQHRLGEAEAAIETALQFEPARVDSLRQFGWVLIAQHRYGQAQLAFLRACELAPDNPVCLQELAETRLRAGHVVQGLATVDSLLQRWPDRPAGLLLQARLLTEGCYQVPEGHARALALCRRLVSDPALAGEATRLLVRLVGLGAVGARAALALLPVPQRQPALRDGLADACVRHGHATLGRLASAAAQDFPLDPWIATAALYAASLSESSQPEDLALSARDWYRAMKLRVGLQQAGRPDLPRRHGTRPRIAYIAGQLHQKLLRRVLANHDPERAEIFVFSNRPLQELPPHIHCEPLVLETLATSCSANLIDVVIDAGGLHPFEGQLGLLEAYARRLAPLQIGWLGCWGPAGGLFDVVLSDATAIPVAHERHHEESVWRLEGGQWCWDPPDHAPELVPPPARSNGFVTFGVTARGLRLNQASLQAWAQAVVATPRSQLRFIGLVADDWPQRAHILATLQSHGVAASRVAFDPQRSYEGLLRWFQQIDLVLDTFPGNGGLSLLDPLWMGVPVVSVSGDWAGARQGLSILSALGHAEWVADSADTFVETAVALACDLEALTRHRADLRTCLQASPLTDGRRVARQIEDACGGFVDRWAADETGADPKQRVKAQARRALLAWLDRRTHLDLPAPAAHAAPDLSVIVVLYNQAGLSRRTLQALADQRGPSFETIIVDNASSDETAALLQRVRGARTVSNPTNLGFLLAANQAAALAKGRHLVFVNSDAMVQQGALAAACARLDAEPAIGALGGRIVLTSGGLQEAGNRIFRDGTTLGIGRGEDPFCPAAMASRATDYVSGVFLAVPTPLWRMLGGFDESFAPAYYEDTDFCLRVWNAGFRVVVDPAILVEHLEWGSAAHDEAPRQMRENRQRFEARHGAWLRGQPRPTAQPLDGDRWRSPEDHPRRPRILVIDNEVPHMVKGGGLPRARLMLQALRDWPVTLFPLWTADDDWREVYASLPPSIEVMLGHGMGRLEAFLEQRRGLYDVLLVSRPPNLRALQPLRARRPELFAGMRLVYDAEALFALREIAEAAVKGRPLSRPAAQTRLANELALARGAEQVLVVSERDATCFRAAGHRVTILSHAIVARRTAPGLSRRSGMLFVGALHPDTPNEDGLVWFIEQVMPLLRALLPQPPALSVVGINRSNRVGALAGPDIRLLGPQDRLEPLYDSARVFIAPVRFAGGVPAKVIEAAAQGVPVVASALLVRQLGWQEGLDIQGARDAAAFARGVARLLRDDALWRRQQQAAWDHNAARYDPERFGDLLRHALAAPSEPPR